MTNPAEKQAGLSEFFSEYLKKKLKLKKSQKKLPDNRRYKNGWKLTTLFSR